VRTASFFWVQSLVRDDGQRQLLFDLDTQIQKLRERLGDCVEVVALTGHYHNLLRRWADT
jgi:PKHD-type hydroxylase